MSDVLRLMIIVLYSWLALYLMFTGLGLFISRAFGRKFEQGKNMFTSFWLGWALVVLILQLWHFLFPVNSWIFILISLIGATGLLWNLKGLRRWAERNFFKRKLFFFFLLLMSIWLANRAVCFDRLYDTGLYHLSSVHWTTAFPVVPGLGNLHGRLAFNNSYFLYSGLLEVGPWTLKSQHLSGGLLLLVLFAQMLFSGYSIFQRKGRLQSYHLFTIILLAPVLIKGFSNHISSLSPDLPIFILGVVLSAQLLAFLENQNPASQEKEYAVFFIIIMAVLGITIKISFLVFGASAALLTAIIYIFRNGKHYRFKLRKIFIWSIACVVLLLGPWMARGVILSGYLFYPSTIASFPVEWRLPTSAAVEEANWIRGWARKPNVHWNEVLGNWDWLKQWADRTLKDYEVAVPLILVFMGCFLLVYSRFKKSNNRNTQKIKWLFLLPPLISVVYWFFTAPALRFIGANLWVLGSGVMILGVRSLKSKKILILSLAVFILLSWFISEKIPQSKELMRSSVYPLRYAELKRFKTNSGLIIYVPKNGDQCWNGPLLCTPFPKENLRLRTEGDISKGFILNSKD